MIVFVVRSVCAFYDIVVAGAYSRFLIRIVRVCILIRFVISEIEVYGTVTDIQSQIFAEIKVQLAFLAIIDPSPEVPAVAALDIIFVAEKFGAWQIKIQIIIVVGGIAGSEISVGIVAAGSVHGEKITLSLISEGLAHCHQIDAFAANARKRIGAGGGDAGADFVSAAGRCRFDRSAADVDVRAVAQSAGSDTRAFPALGFYRSAGYGHSAGRVIGGIPGMPDAGAGVAFGFDPAAAYRNVAGAVPVIAAAAGVAAAADTRAAAQGFRRDVAACDNHGAAAFIAAADARGIIVAARRDSSAVDGNDAGVFSSYAAYSGAVGGFQRGGGQGPFALNGQTGALRHMHGRAFLFKRHGKSVLTGQSHSDAGAGRHVERYRFGIGYVNVPEGNVVRAALDLDHVISVIRGTLDDVAVIRSLDGFALGIFTADAFRGKSDGSFRYIENHGLGKSSQARQSEKKK